MKRFTKLKRSFRKGVKKASPFIRKGREIVIKGIDKATPIVKKQIKLIREQQLRDEKLEALRTKRIKKPKMMKKASSLQEDIFAPLDF